MSSDLGPFSRVLVALAPWLDQIVIIGGWAHQLYRRHPAAQELDYPPLMTLDTDVAIPPSLPRSIRDRLRDHGFTEEFFGEDRPPATHYRLGGESSGFYVEFITPLTGDGHDRKGKRRATLEVAGVSSQRLRHVEILLDHPWSIDFQSAQFTGKVQIANPVSYLAQKVLIYPDREREGRAKDILYMHDTLQVFGARLHELEDLWRLTVAPQLHPRKASALSRAAAVLFGSLNDDIRRAAQIVRERALSPEAIREACEYGFTQVFGPPRGT